MKQTFFFVILSILLGTSGCHRIDPISSKDWPMFGHDSLRSQTTTESAKINQFAELWSMQSPQQPKPAWRGPAIWDGYAKSDVLPSMRSYDLVFQPIVVGDYLYYGSSGDDALHCVEVATGVEKWFFPTEGPIRIAPVYQNGKLYFGSDDGFAYAVWADNGQLAWKFSPTNDPERFLCDGKMIPFYPIRTGVSLKEGKAYFASSLLPWKQSFLCAVDAETGVPEGEGTYIKPFMESTYEGSMLTTDEYIIQPQGRVSPTIFDRRTGEPQRRINGASGSFVLITPDAKVNTITGSRGLKLTESSVTESLEKTKMVSFDGGKALVVSADTSFVVTEKVIAAHDRKLEKVLWSRENFFSIAMIKVGNYLIAGGVDKIEAFDSSNGKLVWNAKVQGKAHGLIFAQDRLFVSTDEGVIHCFEQGDVVLAPTEETREYTNDILRSNVIMHQKTSSKSLETRNDSIYMPFIGPQVRFTSNDKAIVQWKTEEKTMSTLVFNRDGEIVRFGSAEGVRDHRVELYDLRKDRFYSYHIETEVDGEMKQTEEYDLDNFFNYTTASIEEDHGVEIKRETKEDIKQIFTRQAARTGVALVCGIERSDYLISLAQNTTLKVIGISKNKNQVESIREELLRAGVYGERISVYTMNTEDEIPFPTGIFNLIVNDDTDEELLPEEMVRLIRPKGGKAILRNTKTIEAWRSGHFDALAQLNRVNFTYDPDGWFVLTKMELNGAGDWTHQYGHENNTAFNKEKMYGAEDASDFEIAWMGRPGPRYQADRSGRKVGPLAVDGKLLLQGLNRIVALDAYNGKILWSCELPYFMRFNVPRDCGNWCTDDTFVYIALNDKGIKINHTTGEMTHYFPLVTSKVQHEKYDWEYIANHKEMLIGTSTRRGASYELFSGGYGWWDGVSGEQTDQVCSDNIFGYRKKNGEFSWNYENGLIVNSSITIDNNRIWFVENINPHYKKKKLRRMGGEPFWKKMQLVCLDATTGEVIYTKPYTTQPGIPAFYMSYSDGNLVALSSHDGYFYVRCMEGATAEEKWNKKIVWSQNHHGGHLSRPAIVKEKLFIRPAVLNVETGEELPINIPYGKCGSYACSENAVFYRSSNVSMWNTNTAQLTKWSRLRPDCWISTIPSQGMLLSPEGGGGCSCGNWLETSIGFGTRTHGELMFHAPLPDGRLYNDSIVLSMSTLRPDLGTIHYTLDGTRPTTKSPVYSTPLTFDDNQLVRGSLIDKKGVTLVTLRKEYKRNDTAPSIASKEGKTTAWVTAKAYQKGAQIRYTFDGSVPNQESPLLKDSVQIQLPSIVRTKAFWQSKNKKWHSTPVSQTKIYPKEEKKK